MNIAHLSTYRPSYLSLCMVMLIGGIGGCASFDKCESASCKADPAITADVRTRLDARPDLEGLNKIEVKTRRGVVYLTGEVSDGLEARIAESLARETTGVVRVENLVSVSK